MRTGPYRRGRNEAPRVAKASPIGTTGDSASAAASHEVRRLELVDQVGQPDVGQRDDRVGDQPDQDHHPDRPSDTRRSWASLGSLTPAASAQALRRSSRSQSWSPMAWRVGRSTAAAAAPGQARRAPTRPAPPGRLVPAQPRARSPPGPLPGRRHVGVVGGHPGAPEVPKAAVPSGRTTIREASSRRCATPRACSRPRLAQMRSRSSSSTSPGPSARRGGRWPRSPAARPAPRPSRRPPPATPPPRPARPAG